MTPVLQALLVAENVYRIDDGRVIIAGVFNGITIGKEKVFEQVTDDEGNTTTLGRGEVPGSPYAYISLTDVCDNTELQLQFVSLTKNRVLFHTGIHVRNSNRLATVEIVAALPPLTVSEPGVYALEIVSEGEIIGSHRIVADIENGDKNDHHSSKQEI